MSRPRKALAGLIVAVGAWASLAGCAHIVTGAASYRPHNSADPHLSVVKIAALPSLILQPPEIAAVMGAEYEPVAVYATLDASPGIKALDRKCVGAMLAGAEPMYRGSNYGGVSGLGLKGPDDRLVDEAAVAFPDATAATEFVKTRVAQWKDCVNKVLTLDPPGQAVTHWVAQDPIISYGVSALLRMQEGAASSFGCSHALAARSNVVADVLACSHQPDALNDQAASIANKMLGTIQR